MPMKFLKRLLKSLLLLFFATLSSLILVFSVSLAHFFIKGEFSHLKKYTKTEVKVQKPEEIQKEIKPQKPQQKPKRQPSKNRSPKSGPRFSMDLSTIGATGGASINEELIKDIRTGNMGKTEDGVDEKPSSRRLPSFNAPAAIRDAEQDAILRISFCVDTQGSAYEIKILEESPTGKGLAESGKQALMQMQFNPAQKNGKAVSFCGMEQAFEVKFRD